MSILFVLLSMGAASCIGAFYGALALLRLIGQSLAALIGLLAIAFVWCGVAIWGWVAMDILGPRNYHGGEVPPIELVLCFPLWLIFGLPSFAFAMTIIGRWIWWRNRP